MVLCIKKVFENVIGVTLFWKNIKIIYFYFLKIIFNIKILKWSENSKININLNKKIKKKINFFKKLFLKYKNKQSEHSYKIDERKLVNLREGHVFDIYIYRGWIYFRPRKRRKI